MKCSSDISNFVVEISSLTLSVVFLYFFVLSIDEGLLVSPCYSLELHLVLGSLLGFKELVNFSFFGIGGCDIDLDY